MKRKEYIEKSIVQLERIQTDIKLLYQTSHQMMDVLKSHYWGMPFELADEGIDTDTTDWAVKDFEEHEVQYLETVNKLYRAIDEKMKDYLKCSKQIELEFRKGTHD